MSPSFPFSRLRILLKISYGTTEFQRFLTSYYRISTIPTILAPLLVASTCTTISFLSFFKARQRQQQSHCSIIILRITTPKQESRASVFFLQKQWSLNWRKICSWKASRMNFSLVSKVLAQHATHSFDNCGFHLALALRSGFHCASFSDSRAHSLSNLFWWLSNFWVRIFKLNPCMPRDWIFVVPR